MSGCGYETFDIDNVGSFGSHVFENCTKLKDFAYHGSESRIPGFFVAGCVQLTRFQWDPAVSNVGESAFRGCSQLEPKLEWSQTTVTLGDSSFSGCAVVSFTDTVNFRSSVFADCVKLQRFEYSGTAASIPPSLFAGCVQLTKFKWTPTVNSIGDSAFKGCFNLDPMLYLKLDSNVELGEYSLSGCAVNSFTQSNNVNFGSSVFADCVKLQHFEYSGTASSIPPSLFAGCVQLTKFKWTSTVNSIGDSAFKGCSNLDPMVDMKLDSIVTLGEYSLSGCAVKEMDLSNIETLRLSRGVFVDCPSLRTCSLPALNDGIIQPELFSGCAMLQTLTLTSDVKSVDAWGFSGCRALDPQVNYSTHVLIDYRAFSESGLTEIDLTEVKTLSLGESAFKDCRELQHVLLPETLYHLPSFVFAGCNNIADITIPTSVRSFGRGCFENCASLNSVTYMGSAEPADSIFAGCSSLKTVTVRDSHESCYFGGAQSKPCNFVERSPGGFAGIMIAVAVVIAAAIVIILRVTGHLACARRGDATVSESLHDEIET